MSATAATYRAHRETSTSTYDRGEKVVFAEKRELRDVLKSETRRATLLTQEIETDADFDLASVIKAINKL